MTYRNIGIVIGFSAIFLVFTSNIVMNSDHFLQGAPFKKHKSNVSKFVKKLKERIEELEFIKELQQDIIIDFEKVTGEELSKKFLPETLANEIARKKKKLTR